MSAARRRTSSNRRGDDGTSAWAILHQLLVETLGDESRAATLLSSALGASELEAPPTSAGAVLSFAKTHLLPLVREATGARIAVAFVAGLESRLGDLPQIAANESGRRRRAVAGTVPAPPSAAPTPPLALPALPVFRKKLPSITGAEGRPVVVMIGTDDFERSSLARALVQEGLDVRSIETTRALTAVLGGRMWCGSPSSIWIATTPSRCCRASPSRALTFPSSFGPRAEAKPSTRLAPSV